MAPVMANEQARCGPSPRGLPRYGYGFPMRYALLGLGRRGRCGGLDAASASRLERRAAKGYSPVRWCAPRRPWHRPLCAHE